jgi:hypothetical protein
MPNNDSEVAGGMLEAKNLIEFLVNEWKDLAVDMTELKSDIKDLKKDNATLLKLVRDGNGVPPLMKRVDRLEERQEIALENVKGRYVVIAASLTGLIGVATAIIALLR